ARGRTPAAESQHGTAVRQCRALRHRIRFDGAAGGVSLVVLDATSGGPYTEPFTVDYAYGAAQSTAMFTQPLPERWIRFEGLNTADGNREVVIDLYRVAINPAKELSIITDELLKFELSGQVLADLTKPVGGDLGQFGRLVLM
ncbi:phage tail tube protein, partial [Ralstonia mannitolilytica]